LYNVKFFEENKDLKMLYIPLSNSNEYNLYKFDINIVIAPKPVQTSNTIESFGIFSTILFEMLRSIKKF